MNEFVEQSLVFIGAALILVPIFRRLGFGSVLGYLIAGILVGPRGLGLIGNADAIMHFSELGVVFLLFLIGIEIQPHKLWSMRRHLLGLGGIQVAVCTLVFSGAAWSMGLSPFAAVVVGFGLSLSSTAFAVQTLVEKNQFNTEFGRASFAVLLMQDLLAIPALAIIPALGVQVASGHDVSAQGSHWLKISGAVFMIAVLILASRFLMKPMFRVIASTRSREIFTAATLFIVLGVAVLMQKIGLSAALGTFIAGVLLADSEYRHELETNLEPFKSLLMGLFFIAVGMSVRLDLIFARPSYVLTLAASYLLVKMLLIYGVGRSFRLNHINSKFMALNIAQGGEFAFVLFGIVTQGGVAPSETLALLTVVITLSMAMNPLLVLADERWSSLAKKETKPAFDEIKDEAPEVIIAGFGRFGQIFGRILKAQDIPFVAIDRDPSQIDLVRRFGSQVYYGDAARKDLLESAGAASAKYFILAIDEVETSLEVAKLIRESFPNMKIFARARNRGHAFDLMQLGIRAIRRETFESSVSLVGELLIEMGFVEEKAQVLTEAFKRHDEIMLQEQFKVRNDDKMFVSVSKQSVAQLAQVLNDDSIQSHIR